MSRYISLVSPINHHRQASKKNIGKNILCVSKTKYIVYYLHDGTKSRSKLRSKTANEQNEEKRKERERERWNEADRNKSEARIVEPAASVF